MLSPSSVTAVQRGGQLAGWLFILLSSFLGVGVLVLLTLGRLVKQSVIIFQYHTLAAVMLVLTLLTLLRLSNSAVVVTLFPVASSPLREDVLLSRAIAD